MSRRYWWLWARAKWMSRLGKPRPSNSLGELHASRPPATATESAQPTASQRRQKNELANKRPHSRAATDQMTPEVTSGAKLGRNESHNGAAMTMPSPANKPGQAARYINSTAGRNAPARAKNVIG